MRRLADAAAWLRAQRIIAGLWLRELALSVRSGERRLELAVAALALALAVGAVLLLTRPWQPELPDFGAIEDVTEKKARFFDYLLPMVRAENARVLERRAFLLSVRERLAAGEALAGARRRLERLAERYRVELGESVSVADLDRLPARVDVIPPSLALAQAASESAWGTSRFAREGNNLFGEWCFTEGCGIVPGRRGAGKRHEVEAFPSVQASIRSYFRNLNTLGAYRRVRELRARARAAGEPIRGSTLAAGLERYSERGQAYVEEVRAIISYNDLEAFAPVAAAETRAPGPPRG